MEKTTITLGDLAELLTAKAKQCRDDIGAASLKRNSHMHNYIGPPLSQEAVDAVLVGFINYCVMPMDLALYARDLTGGDGQAADKESEESDETEDA